MGPKHPRAGIGKKTVGFKNEVASTAGSNVLGKEVLPDLEQKAGPQPPFPGRDVRGKQGPKAVNGPHYQEKVAKKGNEGNSEKAGHLPQSISQPGSCHSPTVSSEWPFR